MEIIRGKPIARGVTELMYVGDDEAVEQAVTPHHTLKRLAVGVLGYGALTQSGGLLGQAAGAYLIFKALVG